MGEPAESRQRFISEAWEALPGVKLECEQPFPTTVWGQFASNRVCVYCRKPFKVGENVDLFRSADSDGFHSIIVHQYQCTLANAGCAALLDHAVPDGVECTYRREPCGRAVVCGDRCERHQEVNRG